MADTLSSSPCHIWWHSFVGHNADDGKPKSFYVEFYLCNPGSGGPKPVFGQSRASKSAGVKPSYLMVNAGSWGDDHSHIHRFYGCCRAEIDGGSPFSISAGECFLTDDATRGSVSVTPDEASGCRDRMSGSGSMSWSLVIDRGAGTSYRGEVIWNGERYIVDPSRCCGYADCLSTMDLPFVRLFSSSLKGESSGGKVRGASFEFRGVGGLKFQLPAGGRWFRSGGPFCRTVAECREATRIIVWHIEQRRLFSRLVLDVSCRKRDMLLMGHETPDGRKVGRHWSGGTGTGTLTLYRFGREIKKLRADNIFCDYAK